MIYLYLMVAVSVISRSSATSASRCRSRSVVLRAAQFPSMPSRSRSCPCSLSLAQSHLHHHDHRQQMFAFGQKFDKSVSIKHEDSRSSRKSSWDTMSQWIANNPAASFGFAVVSPDSRIPALKRVRIDPLFMDGPIPCSDVAVLVHPLWGETIAWIPSAARDKIMLVIIRGVYVQVAFCRNDGEKSLVEWVHQELDSMARNLITTQPVKDVRVYLKEKVQPG